MPRFLVLDSLDDDEKRRRKKELDVSNFRGRRLESKTEEKLLQRNKKEKRRKKQFRSESNSYVKKVDLLRCLSPSRIVTYF